MEGTAAAAAAAAGAGLSVLGLLAYLRDIRRGSTVPHRGSWLVWSAISVVATVAHGHHGLRWSLLVLGAQSATTLVVLLLAVRRGVGGVTLGNGLLLLVAGVGVTVWLTTDSPVAGAAGAALADGAGLAAIVPKIWRRPWSETTSTYALAGASGLLAVASAGATDVSLLLFPVYYCLANGAVAVLIVRRRGARRGGAPAGPAADQGCARSAADAGGACSVAQAQIAASGS